jgi:hypothetical protein
MKADDDIRGHDVITHAQTIMGNGVIIVPPRIVIDSRRKLTCFFINQTLIQ